MFFKLLFTNMFYCSFECRYFFFPKFCILDEKKIFAEMEDLSNAENLVFGLTDPFQASLTDLEDFFMYLYLLESQVTMKGHRKKVKRKSSKNISIK